MAWQLNVFDNRIWGHDNILNFNFQIFKVSDDVSLLNHIVPIQKNHLRYNKGAQTDDFKPSRRKKLVKKSKFQFQRSGYKQNLCSFFNKKMDSSKYIPPSFWKINSVALAYTFWKNEKKKLLILIFRFSKFQMTCLIWIME